MSEEMKAMEVVDTKTGEIVSTDTPSLVFGTQDSGGIIEKATDVANKLSHIVETAKLYSMIKDKKYVKAEGWTTMAAMLGVFPSVEYCRRLDREGEIAYESKVTLAHISGRIVGAGEAICSSAERSWNGRDEYAIKSMAQTRALGKACRISFSWIMALAGYEACPAEEMVAEPSRTIAMPKAKTEAIPTTPEKEAYEAQRPPKATEDEFGPLPPDLGPEEPIPAIPQPPRSKFYAQLHKAAREKGIAPETMKKAILVLYNKTSSHDLLDGECASLIKAIEKGAIK